MKERGNSNNELSLLMDNLQKQNDQPIPFFAIGGENKPENDSRVIVLLAPPRPDQFRICISQEGIFEVNDTPNDFLGRKRFGPKIESLEQALKIHLTGIRAKIVRREGPALRILPNFDGGPVLQMRCPIDPNNKNSGLMLPHFNLLGPLETSDMQKVNNAIKNSKEAAKKFT